MTILKENDKKLYRDIRARFRDDYTDADIIISLEVSNDLMVAKLKILQMDYDNLKEKYARALVQDDVTADAIPVEWIEHYMDTELTKGSLFYSCMSEFMRDWKKEQEKQNESD